MKNQSTAKCNIQIAEAAEEKNVSQISIIMKYCSAEEMPWPTDLFSPDVRKHLC